LRPGNNKICNLQIYRIIYFIGKEKRRNKDGMGKKKASGLEAFAIGIAVEILFVKE
jgi:hypothetical protein